MSHSVKTPKGTELPLLNLKGKSYLQVAHRLVWFREEKPDWSIETSFIELADKKAVARAVIRDSKGTLIATAHKSETANDFPDFMEKAETGSIGRALALCGYGTQFTDDLEEGGRLADSPVATKNGPRPIVAAQPHTTDGHPVDVGYRVPFGKFAQRSLEEIDMHQLRAYVEYLEKKAHEKGEPITGQVKEFIERAIAYIVAFETSPIK